MADLGPIGVSRTQSYASRLWETPAFSTKRSGGTYSRSWDLPVGGSGQLSGVVKQAGTPVSGRWVRLYYRKTGGLIGSVQSGVNGEFSFGGLDPGAQYFVIAFDDLNQAPDFNAVIFDLLTPV